MPDTKRSGATAPVAPARRLHAAREGHPHKPHLLALNINGMRKDGPKILTLGQGDRELEMLRVVAAGDYHGPVGILCHRDNLDAEVALRDNVAGLRELSKKLG